MRKALASSSESDRFSSAPKTTCKRAHGGGRMFEDARFHSHQEHCISFSIKLPFSAKAFVHASNKGRALRIGQASRWKMCQVKCGLQVRQRSAFCLQHKPKRLQPKRKTRNPGPHSKTVLVLSLAAERTIFCALCFVAKLFGKGCLLRSIKVTTEQAIIALTPSRRRNAHPGQ